MTMVLQLRVLLIYAGLTCTNLTVASSIVASLCRETGADYHLLLVLIRELNLGFFEEHD